MTWMIAANKKFQILSFRWAYFFFVIYLKSQLKKYCS